MEKEIIHGILHIDGHNTVELSEEYGTPLYVLSEKAINKRIENLKEDFLNKYENVRVAYAAKAFCTIGMCRICQRQGLGIDVVSGGELYTALKSGFPPEQIEFNGNNKTIEEIRMAVENNIGRIIVDNAYELSLIEEIAKENKAQVKILLRVNPGVEVDTHKHITTGNRDGKFGIDLEGDLFSEIVKTIIGSSNMELMGIHAHIGSQIFQKEPYLKTTEILLELVEQIYENHNYEIQELNLGGGFGVDPAGQLNEGFAYYLDPVMEKIQAFFKKKTRTRPAIIIEPGRSLVSEAGLTLYTIGSIKEIEGIRTYLAVDGGMSDNIRPALYGAEYFGMVANRGDSQNERDLRVVGKFCESGDILIENIKVPKDTRSGDIFAIFNTGAYGYSMASNYNRSPIPPVVLLKENGESQLMVKRQSYQQLIENDN